MRTHVKLDDHLINEVIQLGHFASKTAAIHAALAELARQLKRQQLLALRGKVAWQGDLEQLRARREAV